MASRIKTRLLSGVSNILSTNHGRNLPQTNRKTIFRTTAGIARSYSTPSVFYSSERNISSHPLALEPSLGNTGSNSVDQDVEQNQLVKESLLTGPDDAIAPENLPEEFSISSETSTDANEPLGSGTDIDIVVNDVNSTLQGRDQADNSIHYIDTYKIYTGLKYSGFTDGQADVLTQATRAILSRRLSECKELNYPIGSAENEAYLFTAACSELRMEIQMARQAQSATYRSALARLQRDTEILQQELNEMIAGLKSEVDMELNERKNATQAEERNIELQIQELNNKITIDIDSEIKSQIEGLRWQTTRRGLMAVSVVALTVVVGISTNKKEEKEVKLKVQQEQKAKTQPEDLIS